MSTTFSPHKYTKVVVPPDYTFETFVVQDDPLTISADSWDELRLQVWGVFPEIVSPADMVGAGHVPPLGTELNDWIGALEDWDPVDGGRWWLQGVNLKTGESNCVFEGELLFKGVADVDKPYKMSIDAAASEFEASDIQVTDGFSVFGPFPKMRSVEPELTVQVAYPVIGSAPRTETVGMMAAGTHIWETPPYEPALRAFWWATVDMSKVQYNWPYDWWKTRMPVDCLAGVAPDVAHYAVDHWRFTYATRPT